MNQEAKQSALIGRQLLDWRRQRHGDGCVSIECALAAEIGDDLADFMKGWGSSVFISSGPVDHLDLSRLDLLLIGPGEDRHMVVNMAKETIRRTQPYVLVIGLLDANSILPIFAELGYTRWAISASALLFLPFDDPNWANVLN